MKSHRTERSEVFRKNNGSFLPDCHRSAQKSSPLFGVDEMQSAYIYYDCKTVNETILLIVKPPNSIQGRVSRDRKVG